jgi:hypothetical protein
LRSGSSATRSISRPQSRSSAVKRHASNNQAEQSSTCHKFKQTQHGFANREVRPAFQAAEDQGGEWLQKIRASGAIVVPTASGLVLLRLPNPVPVTFESNGPARCGRWVRSDASALAGQPGCLIIKTRVSSEPRPLSGQGSPDSLLHPKDMLPTAVTSMRIEFSSLRYGRQFSAHYRCPQCGW